MLQLTKEQIAQLYKERNEALFFDFKPLKIKRAIVKKPNKIVLDESGEVFNHFISLKYWGKNYHWLSDKEKKDFSKRLYNKNSTNVAKQVVIKNLSNLDKFAFARALNYVVRNSDDDFVYDENGDKKYIGEIIEGWDKDFKGKKNSKEVLHLAFCMAESGGEYYADKLKKAVEQVMQKNFYLYKYAIVIHTHQKHLHAHILLNKNNIIDGQKFHLNNKEFKLFFNQLRNDFATALNTQGFHYQNRYRVENDLQNLQDKMKKFRFDDEMISKVNVIDELVNLQENITKRIKYKNEKIERYEVELAQARQRQKDLREEITQIRNDFKDKPYYSRLYKRLAPLYKELKSVNLFLRGQKEIYLALKKEKESLQSDFDKIEFKKKDLRQSEDIWLSNIVQKKKYLDFITSNIDKKTLTKSEINLKIKQIQQDIILSDKSVSDLIKRKVKDSIQTTKILNKDNNAFTLINNYYFLTKNINALKKCDIDKELFEEYEKILENNREILKNLLIQKFDLLERELEYLRSKNKLRAYKVREYERLSEIFPKRYELNKDKIKQYYDMCINKGAYEQKQALQQRQDEIKPQGGQTRQDSQQNEVSQKTPQQEFKKEPQAQNMSNEPENKAQPKEQKANELTRAGFRVVKENGGIDKKN